MTRADSAAGALREPQPAIDDAAQDLSQTVTRVDLQEGGGALPPGAYLVSLDGVEDTWMRYHTLLVSELNLTLKGGEREALVWATRLSDGTPAANVPITFYTGENRHRRKAQNSR